MTEGISKYVIDDAYETSLLDENPSGELFSDLEANDLGVDLENVSTGYHFSISTFPIKTLYNGLSKRDL